MWLKKMTKQFSKRSRKSNRLLLETLEARTVPTIAFTQQFGPPITFHDGGGDVLNNVTIELLFNGSYWQGATGSPGAAHRAQAVTALSTLLTTPYLSGTSQYRPGVLPGTPTLDQVKIDPNTLSSNFGRFSALLLTNIVPGPGTLSGNVNFAIDSGLVPGPDSAHHRLYLEVTAPGVVQTDAVGFHAWFPDFDNWLLVPNPVGLFPPFIQAPTSLETVFDAWVSTKTQDGTPDGPLNVDAFTRILSHELVEAVTDPSGEFTLPSIFNPPVEAAFRLLGLPTPGWTGSGGKLGVNGSDHELADGEPENSYFYRLGGVSTQAYWSVGDRAFVVPDGNRQTFTIDPSTNTLHVRGDQIPGNANDNILINRTTVANGGPGLLVNLNGEVAVFDPGEIDAVIVDSGGGNDSITVAGLPWLFGANHLTINLGNGTDAVNLVGLAQNIDAVHSDVIIHGGGGADTLQVNDAANVRDHTYTMDAGSIHREDNATMVRFDGMSSVYLNGGTGHEDYEIRNTPSHAATFLNLAASPTNLVNLQADSGTVDIYSSNADSASNRDTLNIGAGNLDTLVSLVTVHGQPTSTGVNVQDQNENSTSRIDMTISATGMTRVVDTGYTGYWGLFDPTPFAGLNYSGLAGLTFAGGSGPNSVNVVGTAAGAPVTVNAGPGTDTVDLGAPDLNPNHLGRCLGSLDPIAALVSVNGNGSSTTLNVDDTAVTSAQTYNVTAGRVDRTGLAGVLYSRLNFLEVFAGFGTDTVNVESTGTSQLTTVHGSPTSAVNIAPSSRSLDGIRFLDVYQANTLTIHDRGSGPVQPGVTAYSLDGSSLVRTATYLDFGGGLPVVTTRSSTINYFYMANVVLNAGPRHNTISVGGTSAATTINAGPRADTIAVGNSLDNIGLLHPSTVPHTFNSNGLLTVNANGGSLLLVDRGTQDVDSDDGVYSIQDTHTSITYTITSGSVVRFDHVNETIRQDGGGDIIPPPPTTITHNLYNFSETINYNGASSLAMDGSSVAAGATFTVDSTVLTTPLTINGGAASDRLVGPNVTNLWLINGTNQGQLGNVSFAAIGNLTGGTSADTFVMANGATVAGWINGNSGINTLDYSAYTTPVMVNLSAFGNYGSAMNAHGVMSNFQNVIGSRTAVNTLTGSNLAPSILVGGANNDVLAAGTQRAILIGGLGADTLNGGPADDILISGTTRYDTNLAALQSIMAEWASNHTYADRIDLLRGAATNPLYGSRSNGNFFLNASTVFGDTAADRLMGGAGSDWFWATLPQDTTDRTGTEALN